MQHDDDDEMASDATVARARLPDWPRLMPLRLACAYFGVCDKTFRSLGIAPRRIGRRVLWDRRDLDRFADGIAPRTARPTDSSAGMRAMERRFYARMNDAKTGTAGG
ncbi:helix-turn-helix domain-containing protein [Sphingomonas sp. Leaf25]|uniref:helix-turn-helix domain-containing protein n=1 Tax=Sphingomonas sp. Leaf25 TaxID=1735692 RepID=UPI0006F69A1C|nr:helix-turn-helix domain-containing protein [Sphingomonas sp. Leaf25]KQN06921.1 hypothetical protein ASE78_14970 [Sphingomonas sp. Leaf25]